MIPILSIQEKKAQTYKVRSSFGKSVNDVQEDRREVDIILNTYYYFDSYADVLVPGVCKKSIDEHGVNSPEGVRKIKFAKSHNLTMLPGKFTYLEEEKINSRYVLRGNAKMAKTTLGEDTLEEYKEQIWDNHSIGFRYLQLEFMDRKSTDWEKCVSMLINPEDAEAAGFMWWVKEIELYEGSCVAVGANELTESLGLKSNNQISLNETLILRMKALDQMIKNRTASEETIELLSLQIKQLIQVIYEYKEPEKKPTEKSGNDSTLKKIDYSKLEKSIKNSIIKF